MTDELKSLLKAAKTEEAQAILEAHTDEITDADLDELKGGTFITVSCVLTWVTSSYC